MYVLQPMLQHYRLPIWDLLNDAGRGRYDVHAFGEMADGHAFGGGSRPYLHPMPERKVPVPLVSLLRWPEARRLIERDRPDIVIIAANPRNLSCWRLRRICRQAGAASVAHTKVDSFAGLPDWAVDRPKRRFLSGFDELVCYGNNARTKALELGYPAHRISVARNTVDLRQIFSDDSQVRRRGEQLRAPLGAVRVLVSVGRVEPDKRFDDLVEAWPALVANHPDLHLVLVGGGPDLDSLRERAGQVDAERITVTGRVPAGDDEAWMAAADLCLLPGAVGLALNQALALGVPTVIADESTSDAELVEHGVTGWRYPRADIGALVAAVEHVLAPEHEDEVRRVREAGRALMRDDVNVEAMVAVFDSVISRHLPVSPPADDDRDAR